MFARVLTWPTAAIKQKGAGENKTQGRNHVLPICQCTHRSRSISITELPPCTYADGGSFEHCKHLTDFPPRERHGAIMLLLAQRWRCFSFVCVFFLNLHALHFVYATSYLIPDMSGGYLCFVVSIFCIGVVTAIIGDVASHFGCTLGIKDSVTAIIFVALGTSIPGKEGPKHGAEHKKNLVLTLAVASL